MRFNDTAILLSLTKYSESTAICRLFSRGHGMIGGAVRGAMSRSKKGDYQPGNLLQVEWSARLPEHLGSLKCEMISPVAAYVLNDSLRLTGLNALLSLTQAVLAEHDPHPRLYDALVTLLGKLRANEADWLADYARYELLLLAEAGFQLELDKCAATGVTENLIYVSPKSGCAVSAQAGEPYKAKLLKLPPFRSLSLQGEEIRDALVMTGYFLEHRLFASHHRPLPPARDRFVAALRKQPVLSVKVPELACV